MFSIPKANVIESDQGFSVEVLGRTGVLYSEGERRLKIDSEVLAGPSGLIIYTDSLLAWLPPHAGDVLDGVAKARITENVRAAFRFRGLEIQVQ